MHLAIGACLALPGSVSVAAPAAHEWSRNASIHVAPGTAHQELTRLARITPEAARGQALEHVKGKVVEVELEVEKGCLVYSVEIQPQSGKTVEVLIDAGTGAYLGLDTETDTAIDP